jgi:hypothetical protein
MMKIARLILVPMTIWFAFVDKSSSAQSFRGIESINSTNLRLPTLTVTGVTLNTTSDGALTQTVTTIDRQQIEIPALSNKKTVIDTYSGTSVNTITLYDPTTFAVGTGASQNPNNCGAQTRANPIGSNPASYSYPIIPGTLPAQNPLGGDYWLGSGADIAVNPVDRTTTSPTSGSGLGITNYICPLIP